MIPKLIDFSIRHRWFVLFAVVGLGALGVYNFHRLPIDAVPDITNIQVQVMTAAPALSPVEVEQYVTVPVERATSRILPSTYAANSST